jgi:hypothetical protein
MTVTRGGSSVKSMQRLLTTNLIYTGRRRNTSNECHIAKIYQLLRYKSRCYNIDIEAVEINLHIPMFSKNIKNTHRKIKSKQGNLS